MKLPNWRSKIHKTYEICIQNELAFNNTIADWWDPLTEDPTCHRDKTEQAALLYWRGQSSPTVNLPVMTSSLRDLLNLAHTLHYLVGPLIGASDYGGVNGRAVESDDGETLGLAMKTQSNATPSIDTRR